MTDRESQVRAIYAAFSAGDFGRARELVSPEFEWHPNTGEPDTAVRHGRRDATARARDVIAAFGDFRTEVEEVHELGNLLAVTVCHTASLAGTSDRVERREAHLWAFEGDRAVSLHEYPTLDQALEAAAGR